MAKLSALTTITTPAAADLFYIVVSAGGPLSRAITYANLAAGFSSAGHVHGAADITSGVLNVARIPTGTTSTTVALGDHTHAASAIVSGTIDIARLPTGTGGTQVALGNHTHAASAIVSGTLAIARIPTGTTSSEVCIGDDARLSDARTPTAHTHVVADITDFDPADYAELAGGNTFSGTQVIDTLEVTTIDSANFDCDGGGVGFFGTSPTSQPAAIADSTDSSDAATQLNLLLAALRSLGIIAT